MEFGAPWPGARPDEVHLGEGNPKHQYGLGDKGQLSGEGLGVLVREKLL